VAFLVDEDVALGVRKAQELLQDGVDLVNVILVENQAVFSDLVAVGDNGRPPSL
jgi:hypothetical protein